MSLRAFAWFGSIVLLVSGAGASEPGKPDQSSDYFPLKAGYQWTYTEKQAGLSIQGPVNTEQAVTFKVTEMKKAMDRQLHLVTISYEKDKKSLELWYGAAQEGIGLFHKKITTAGKQAEIKIDTPQLFIKLPLKTGDKWDYGQFKAENKGEETVKVEAGTFRCLKIVLTNTRPNPIGICNMIGNPNTVTLWLAKDTGLVKQQWATIWGAGPTGGTVTETRELTRFEKGMQ